MEYIALALSLVAVILCIVILTKVNKLLTMLRTPIFKKLTPDMNLKPSARRPISAQEMAQRGGNNKENRQNKERPANNNNKDNRNQQAAAQAPANRERNEQHQRPERGPRRDRRQDRPHREPNAEAPVAEQAAPVAPAAEAPVAEARRPLAPRIPVETPAAPAVEAAPVAPVAEAPAEAAAETVFDPSKVRYGRRNVIKKAPELTDGEA